MFALIALGAFQWLSSRIAPPPAGADGLDRPQRGGEAGGTGAHRRAKGGKRNGIPQARQQRHCRRDLCLGTMTFGAEADEATSHRLLDAYAAAGGNFIDTADVYSAGASEEIIGRWLAAHPAEARPMVIATKGRFPMGRAERRRHLSPPPRPRARRLAAPPGDRTDRPLPDARLGRAHPARGDPALPRRRDARRQDRLLRLLQLPRLAVDQGRARRAGPGLHAAGDAPAAVQPARTRDRARDRARRPRRRHRSPAVVAACRRLARRQVPVATCRRPAPPDSARTRRGMEAYAPRNAQERTWRILDAVAAVARARGVTQAAVALAWLWRARR